jgi:hypothetical protein
MAALARDYLRRARFGRGAPRGTGSQRRNRSATHFLEKRKDMVTIRIKGGTPEGVSSLCTTCTRGHVIRGYSAAEEEVFCRFFFVEREIRYPVRECTFYEDKRLATKEAMEEIAWFLTTRKAGRSIGFVSPAQFRETKDDSECETTPNDAPATATADPDEMKSEE